MGVFGVCVVYVIDDGDGERFFVVGFCSSCEV